jgi:hypothetical protein
MIQVIRQVGDYSLNRDTINQLYNVSSSDNVSFWFDTETKDELMTLSDSMFVIYCLDLIQNSLVN